MILPPVSIHYTHPSNLSQHPPSLLFLLQTFRDLTKPMGALSPAREMEFRERYALLKESEQPDDPRKAFHYGTHFSSAAIVLYYLVRLQPFSEQHVRLQSGRFDHSDRLFSTMRKSWQASSGGLSGDMAANAAVSASVGEREPSFCLSVAACGFV